MFGLVLPNEKALTPEERARYARIYCGICRSLSSRHGRAAKYTLSYDMAFLALVLSDVYADFGVTKSARCVPHPIKKREYTESELIDYTADMTVVLAYHKLLDDYADDKSRIAKHNADKLRGAYGRIALRYGDKCAEIESALAALSELERAGEPSADKAAAAFARTLECVFDYGEKGDKLAPFGAALGKFIYIADACIDLKKDLKKGRYNPMSFYSKGEFQGILEMLSADCKSKLEALPEAYGDETVKNVIYSGMWLKYEILKGREK